ncbi:MAG: hypothetical protein ACFE8N_11940, partial [Promethearchaeota archaeon]
EVLFLQGLNLSARETLDNVFVLSANKTEHHYGTFDFTSEGVDSDIYFAPEDYNDMLPPGSGFAYCEITREGGFDYHLEVGAGVTLIIWDSDRSFITAIMKLINFFNKILEAGGNFSEDLIREGISTLTWFLIHINDIFTGDELFILNPITWQKLDVTPNLSFNVTKVWKVTGDDRTIGGSTADIPINSTMLNLWSTTANTNMDGYMQWLLRPTLLTDVAPTIWTQFSFDLIQLWIKKFQIQIDVAAILDAVRGSSNPERAIINAFDGCDIEFYLFTHHLAGAFLYNDLDSDQRLSANYTPLEDNFGQPITDPQGDPVEVPERSELTHRLILGTVNKFNFETPKINPSNKSVSWGINIEGATISAVPIGVDLNSFLNAPQEAIDDIYFGFTFEPTVDRELSAAKGIIKLDQEFDPWNGGSGPLSPISGLDLAILYVSTVLHFHLQIGTQGQIPEDPEVLLDHQHYNSTSNELTIGNYIGNQAQQQLDFVDIAGPEYLYGNDKSTATSAPATTNILPIAVWEWELERHDTISVQDGGTAETFASNISVSIEFDVLLYAVCYPEFNGAGVGIWHDPTFSVYMVFESEGFWALIVLIAGVGLVGVATILIKRRKDSRF